VDRDRQQHHRELGHAGALPAGHAQSVVLYSGSIARKRRPYSSVRLRASCWLRTRVGVISTTISLRVVLEFCWPNRPPMIGILLRPGRPLEPRLVSSVIRPARKTVSPLCTTALVFRRLVLMRTLPLSSGSPCGLLTSWTMSRNTVPSRVTRGRTLRMVPVSRYCTWLYEASPPRPGFTVTDEIGMRSPTLSVAS